jgi:histone H2A
MDAETTKKATEAGKQKKLKIRSKPQHGKDKYGVTYPVPRFRRELRTHIRAKISTQACVYMIGVFEYLFSELAELSNNIRIDRKRARIIPRDLLLAIRGDEELDRLFKEVCIKAGGVLPHIHRNLLSEHAGKGSKAAGSQPHEQNTAVTTAN